MNRAIIITGPQGSGKTTFGKFLAEALGVPFADTSDAVIEAYAAFRARVSMDSEDALRESFTSDVFRYWSQVITKMKNDYRHRLIAMGDALCHNDPTALIRKAMTDQPLTVIAGVRRIEALNAARDAGLVECTIWIERTDHEPQADNLTITAGDCELIIPNDSGIDALKIEARDFSYTLWELDNTRERAE